MSVIAKLQISSCRAFGTGVLTILNCVCENDLMAAYAKADEDRCFTKYSPWGEAQLGASLVNGVGISLTEGRKFYAIALRGERPACPGAAKLVQCRIPSITDFGDGMAKRVEIASEYGEKTPFNWRMSIDNPPAVQFFTPGASGYWVAFYDADGFDMQAALADAHSDA